MFFRSVSNVVFFALFSIIEQLKISLKNEKKSADRGTDAPSAESVKQLSELIAKKDQELEVRLLYFAKDI